MARTFGDIFLDGVNATQISSKNSFNMANIWDENLLLLFILLKKIWLNLWFGTALRKTHMKFPATI